MSNITKKILAMLMACLTDHSDLHAGTITVLTAPLEMAGNVYPNLILGVDDSGSMDFEVMLNTIDGELWWDTTNKRFADASGNLYSNSAGQDYVRLFPLGSAADASPNLNDGGGYYAVPPIPAYAFMRSADWNPIYYNPMLIYVPWSDDWTGTGTTTESFPAASPTAARSHPLFAGGTTMNLTATKASTAANTTFKMQNGMTIPAPWTVNNTTITASYYKTSTSTWTAVSSAMSLTGATDVSIPYYPATYYVKAASCAVGQNGATTGDCTTAPDGTALRRYEIRSTYAGTYPSGRTYADELQNFANWFTYYRKRKMLLASSMSAVLPTLKNIRIGTVQYNANANATMYDLFTAGSASYVANTNASKNSMAVLNRVYRNPANGGTPGRQTLKYIGDQFKRTDTVAPIQKGYPYWGECSRNAAMLLTDGYADTTTTTPPAYTASTYMGSAPFAGGGTGNLADIAASYYTTNLRPDITAGLVAYDPSNTAPNADRNPNLHMNTYGLTLGAKGVLFGQSDTAQHIAQNANPYVSPYPVWPTTIGNHDPAAIDDMWHATINGRGQMFTATDSASVTLAIKSMFSNIIALAGGGTTLTISNKKLQPGDNTLYESSYNSTSWSGELLAASVDVNTGTVSSSTPLWSLRSNLNAMPWATRKIATYSNTTGAPGGSGVQWSSATTPASATMRNWIAGDRSLEGSTYRQRAYVLGDITFAEPVLVKGSTNVVYQVANDGMVHAVNAATGQELWAYIPGLVLPRINQITPLGYIDHVYVLDGTPAVGATGGNTVLVGGLRNGGAGYYALNITNPTAASSADVASKVLWEYKDANMGYTYGKPVITNTAYGSVALLTSGYNNADGQGHLFVVNPMTGAMIKDLTTGSGTPANPSGLAQIAAFTFMSSNGSTQLSDVIYGGDLNGDLWRFDLTNSDPAKWSVAKLATLKDAAGKVQPITSTPEIGLVGKKRLIMVGTGKLLELTDLTNNFAQTVYAIVDPMDGSTLSNLRSILQPQTITVSAGHVGTSTSASVDWATKKGWYFDLPVGQMVNTDMSLAYGVLSITTNDPDQTQGCHGAMSYLYMVDYTNGGQLNSSYFPSGTSPWASKVLANSYASSPTVAVTASGKLVALVHEADGKIIGGNVTPASTRITRKVAWAEILK